MSGVVRSLALGVAALISTQTVHGIDPNRTMSQYVVEKWGVEQGFPPGPVYSINQTRDGYLWIGAQSGLVRFDGVTFNQMQSGGSEQPSLNHVLGLVADPEGGLWLRLRRPGLTLLRYDRGTFRDVMGDLATRSSVAAMSRGRDGAPVFCLLEGEQSAIVLRGRKFEVLAAPAGLARSAVLAVAQTSSGEFWVGTTDAGLFRISNGRAAAVTKGLPDLKVNALAPGANNELWVGTDSGIVRWDGTKLTKTGVPNSLDGVQVLAIATDRDSNVWIGTNSRGLLRLNGHGLASLAESGQGPSEAVTAILEDREGNMWAGGAAGLQRLRDSSFITYSPSEGLPSGGSSPVFADTQSRVWFAPVNGGLGWFRDAQRGRLSNDGLDRDVVYSIAGKTDLWIGRQRGGLTRLHEQNASFHARTYTQADGLAQNSVYAVYETRDGTIWAGTLSGGVSRLAGSHLTTLTVAEGLLSNTVTSILEGPDGTMWFATPRGLSALSQGHWRAFTTVDGLPSNEVNCVFLDSAGLLWVGTAAGLAFRSEPRFQVPSAAPLSLREQVVGIEEDRFGSLWIATANHVLRVNPTKLRQGSLSEEDVRQYGLADGLRGIEGSKRHRSVVQDSAGRIWFSLNRGIAVVDPARLRNNSVPAIPQIQSISADGNTIGVQDGVHIPGGQRRITFGYAGLSLSIPERVRFRYMLEGFDRNWSEHVATREAIYTNLPPNSYRFRVAATNSEGVWSPTEATIAFQVDPLFWQTWWFRLSVLAGFAISGMALYRLRLKRVAEGLNVRFEERLAERTRIAQELHDTLLQGFLSASMQVHVVADQLPPDAQARPTLTRALELMRQVIDEGRNAVRGLRSSNSASLELEHAFSQVQEELSSSMPGAGPVAFRVVVEGQPRPFHPLLRDEIYRIGREALINAFRHARAKNVEVEIRYCSSQLQMLVRDDGRGINTAVLHAGRDGHFGLSGMRERAERIGARLHIRTGAGAGTELELCIPSHVAFADHRNLGLPWLFERLRRGSADKGAKK